MREIKFRAWEKSLKEIIPVSNIDFDKQMINTDSAWRFFKEIELMQSTGLKDKNGVEIYEGDIVKTNEGYNEKIVFNEASFKCVWHHHNRLVNCILDNLFIRVCEPEVIGNIYEKPELLEVNE